MDWSTCLNTFNQVVTDNSFTKAAESLQLPRTTVSRHVQWLEDTVGETLLRRTTRRLQLTEVGEMLYERSKPLIREWNDLKREATSFHKTPQGVLRIVTAPQLGKLFLAKSIPAFLEKYPDIRISMDYSTTPLNLLEENIDIYIGFEPLVKDKANVVGSFLAPFDRKCYASPDYLKKHGTPKTPEELINHRCIVWLNRHDWELDGVKYRVNDYFNTNSAETMAALAVKGVGIVNMPAYPIQNEINEGKLVEVLEHCKPNVCRMYAYYPKLNYLPLKVKLLIECFKKVFE